MFNHVGVIYCFYRKHALLKARAIEGEESFPLIEEIRGLYGRSKLPEHPSIQELAESLHALTKRVSDLEKSR